VRAAAAVVATAAMAVLADCGGGEDDRVRPVGACRTSAVRVTFSGPLFGLGEAAGWFVIRTTAGTACRLSGWIGVTGLDQRGRRVTPLQTAAPGSRSIVLRPGRRAALPISAQFRDDPSAADGLCSRAQVVPATWRLTFSDREARETPNTDKPNGPLPTCRGVFGVGALRRAR